MRNVTVALFALTAVFAIGCNSSADTPTDPSPPTAAATEGPSIADIVAAADSEATNSPGDGAVTSGGSATGATKPGGATVGAARPTQLKLETPERARLVRAIESTNNLESYEFEYSMTLPAIVDVPGGITMGGSGALDPQNERFSMTIDFSDLFTALAASEDAGPDDLALMQAFLGDDPMEIRYVDGVTYINWALFGMLFGSTTPWIAIEDESSASALDSVSSFGGGSLASPQEAVEFLQDVWGIEEVGRETVRGVETTHYRGVIDFETMLGDLAAADVAELEADLGGASLSEVFGDFPIEVWIDDNDVMRRLTLEMDFSNFGAAGNSAEDIVGSMFMTYEFFNIGGDISIVAPPASEVSQVDDSFLSGFDLAS